MTGPCVNLNEFQRDLEKLGIQLYQDYVTLKSAGFDQDKDALELHARHLRIDRILALLNWHLPHASDSEKPFSLIEEHPGDGRRRMDYLGHLTSTGEVSLLVEAKNPNDHSLPAQGKNSADEIASFLSSSWAVDFSQDVPKKMSLEWKEHFDQIKKYYTDLKKGLKGTPKVVALTNGDWWLIFQQPDRWFDEASVSPDPRCLHVFRTFEDVKRLAKDFFQLLSFENVVGISPVPIEYSKVLRFIPNADLVTRFANAISILHWKEPTQDYQSKPRMTVKPAVVLGSGLGRWMIVTGNQETEVPVNSKDNHRSHLETVEKAFDELHKKLEGVLGKLPDTLSLTEVLTSEKDRIALDRLFESVSRRGNETHQFLLLGSERHFLRLPSCPNCKWHSHANSSKENVQKEPCCNAPTAAPPSFSRDGSAYHCSHRAIYDIKQTKVPPAIEDERFGFRRGLENKSFCMLWDFEERLCCKSCVFQRVCNHAKVMSFEPCHSGQKRRNPKRRNMLGEWLIWLRALGKTFSKTGKPKEG